MKVCTKCGEDKPLSEYGKRSAAPDGLNYHCKSCKNNAAKAYREANHEKVAASDRAYREANREKIAARKKAYYDANPEKRAAANKAYREANREEILAANKAYYEANREKVAAWQKAYHAERYSNDPEYRAAVKASNLRYKRLLKDAKQEPYTRESIFERDNWTCGLCDEPIDPDLQWPESGSASIDHILPVSLGGDDTPDNVQAAHLSCNQGKGNRVGNDQTMLTGVAG